MVTKAIERAQSTVEQRNAEIRKNVLKYDEVMNEQRKVIYKRRDQILEGADLREEALEYLADAVDSTIDTPLRGGVQRGVGPRWPAWPSWPGSTRRSSRPRSSASATATDEIYDLVMAEASAYYERREDELGPDLMREVERQVMLRIIDQRWREHLYEMDYLQEGINLRAMGQQDPLVEWQQDGYEMFGEMMHGIAQDFVRYVMHVQVVQQDQNQTTVVQNLQTHSAEDVSTGRLGHAAGRHRRPARRPACRRRRPSPPRPPLRSSPSSRTSGRKTPRNAPCPCGSGKKFKMCHGK